MSERVVDNPANHGWVEVDGKWVWDASGSSAGAGMVISESEPTDKVEGMQWLNPTTGLVLFWDDEKWLQMPTTGAAGKDGKDAVWSEDANGANYTGTVTVKGELLASKAGAGAGSVSVGFQAGAVTQGEYSAAFGYNAGKESQGTGSVGLGTQAGETDQSDYSVGIGYSAGRTSQGEYAIAVGQGAGRTDQGDYSTALGVNAGEVTQGAGCVAVGWAAGQESQGQYGVSVGRYAGMTNQGLSTVAVGYMAGHEGQGESSIAIGEKAGKTNQGANGIIISSHGSSAENSGNPNHIYIVSGSDKYLYYNGSTEWYFAGGTVNGLNGFRQNGAPVIDAKGLISTLSTLRNATKDETTLKGMRDALADAIGGLIENLEHEIATQEISE
jgi:hypothetical protein